MGDEEKEKTDEFGWMDKKTVETTMKELEQAEKNKEEKQDAETATTKTDTHAGEKEPVKQGEATPEGEEKEEVQKTERVEGRERTFIKTGDAIMKPIPMKCPKCMKETMSMTFTARSFAIKCSSCGWDSNRFYDWEYHRERSLEGVRQLKKRFPELNFVENIPTFNPVTGDKTAEVKGRYDFSVYFLGHKIDRLRMTIVQNQKVEHYMVTDEQYIVGIRNTVSYLTKKDRDALLVFYFRDEPDEKKQIGVASFREMQPYIKTIKDRFGNDQFTLPKNVRSIIIKTDYNGIKQLLFRHFYDAVVKKGGMYII